MKRKMVSLALSLLIISGNLFSLSLKEKEKIAKKFVYKGVKFLKTHKWKVSKNRLWVKKGKRWVPFGEILRDPKSGLKKGQFYLFIGNLKGICYAHGGKKVIETKNMIDLRDTNGKYFVREFTKIAKRKGEGWVDYTWPNPITKKIQNKRSYVKRFEKENFYIVCGFYY